MRYLSGAPYAPCLRSEIGGFMAQPNHSNRPETVDGIVWGADNGCYTSGDSFDAERWLRWLVRRAGRGECLFAVLPDVPFDFSATLARGMRYAGAVRALGYPVGLAIQEGATVAAVPWDDIDAVCIAGRKEFKTSATAWAIMREATRRDKRKHWLRGNSQRAVQAAHDMGADSVDGTFLAFAPDANWQRLQAWFQRMCLHAETRPAWASDLRFQRCVACGAPVWKVA